MSCHSLLQGIFLTQGLNPSLPHCRQILYHLSYQGSPKMICPHEDLRQLSIYRDYMSVILVLHLRRQLRELAPLPLTLLSQLEG